MEIPRHISNEARKWVETVLADYDLEPYQEQLLVQAAEAWDRIEQARQRIALDGPYYQDRFGTPKSHPAVADERNGRVVFARLLRELCLDAGSEPDIRPPRLKY